MKFLIFLTLMTICAAFCSCSKGWEDIEIMPPVINYRVVEISKRFTNPPDLNIDKTWRPYKTVEHSLPEGVDSNAYVGVIDTLISTCSIDKMDSLFKIEIRTFVIK
jgi:hypothetical protein